MAEAGFHGVFPYLVSPIDSSGEVKTGVLERLCGDLIEAGVHGLTPLGSTGEFAYLSWPQLAACIKGGLALQGYDVGAPLPPQAPLPPGGITDGEAGPGGDRRAAVVETAYRAFMKGGKPLTGGIMSARNALVSMVFALSAAGTAADVHAQQWTMEKLDGAYKSGGCSDDLKKFCARVKPGDARVAKCMADNFRQLRPSCQGMVQTALDKLGSTAKACKADAEKFCKGIRPAEGRVLSCLKGREADLSPACTAEFKRAFSDPTVAQ